MSFTNILTIFHIDTLSIIMICLVSFIAAIVYSFSKRYMKGDALYQSFFSKILILPLCVITVSISDNLILFLAAWFCCNLILSQLIVHKPTWLASKASGKLARQNFIVGFALITLAFAIFYQTTGSLSIQYIVHNPQDSSYTLIALSALVMGAMTQSAIWPFHRWLISSLNSPTPVSALMHAGIVSGGGLLLARFSPIYFNYPNTLSLIFIIGLTSALLGSLWKLMQHDVKRMLACSTMGQMGFMFVQMGLGLFASALAHLCWHGLFKCYLFLDSGSAAQEKRINLHYSPNVLCFVFSLACGALGAYIFQMTTHKSFSVSDTTLIILSIVFIIGTQLSLSVLRDSPFKRFPLAISMTIIMASLYGANVYLFDLLLSPLNLTQPQPLNIFHISALVILSLTWLFILLIKYSNIKASVPNWLLKLYVQTLNSSQPHASTITTHRKGYHYV
jgi:NAD(P)H-quinone oxidoreductase subunit 5